jgi:ribosome-associated heat shock protein Hsp15
LQDPTANSEDSVRLDLWAWSVRLYKTRTLAAAACKKSQILVNGQRCRAARQVRVGDEIRVRQGMFERIIEVRALLHRRVAAKEVPAYLADLTPPEEIARVAELERAAREVMPQREAGTGRPTKRERREIDGLADETPSPSFEEFVRAFMKRKPLR